MRSPDAKAAVERMEKMCAVETSQDWKLEKGKEKRRSFWKHKETTTKSSFASLMDRCHLKKPRSWNQNFRNTRAESQRSLNEARLLHKWVQQKSWMSLRDNQIVMDKQPTQYLRVHSGKIGRCSQTAQNPKVRMSSFLDTYSTKQMAKIMVKPWKSSTIPRTKSVWTRTCRIILREKFEKLIGSWMEKGPNWECRFVHRKQGLFLSENVDDIKIAGKKQNIAAMWKNLMKEVDLFEPALFLDRVYYGCTQRDCKPNDD